MLKLLPIVLIGFLLRAEVQAQCNPAFTSIINGAAAQLKATDSAPGKIHRWFWGDGAQAWGPTVSHTYNLPGTYLVKHFITDSLSNCQDSAQQTINISFTISCSASFVIARDSTNPNKYRFTSTSSANGGYIQSYKWTINGDSVSNAMFFKLPLPQGKYFVCLTIKTSTGCTSSVCDSVSIDSVVVPPPPPQDSCTASFTYTANPSQPNQLAFTAISNDSIVAQRWLIMPCDSLYFHDSVVYNTPNPVHTFDTAGCYRVCLTIVTKSGCRKRYCNTVIIHGDSSLLLNRLAGVITSFPNPVYSNPIKMRLSLEKTEKVKLSVYNSFGNLVYSIDRSYQPGINSISIPVDKLQRGMYYIDIRYGNTRKRSTFQKL